MTLHLTRDMSDSQQYPWILPLNDNMEKCLILIIFPLFLEQEMRDHFCRETTKHGYHAWSDIAFKGAVGNPTWHSINRGFLMTALSAKIFDQSEASKFCCSFCRLKLSHQKTPNSGLFITILFVKIKTGTYKQLFHPDQLITGKEVKYY